jgi:hypothetical protein
MKKDTLKSMIQTGAGMQTADSATDKTEETNNPN